MTLGINFTEGADKMIYTFSGNVWVEIEADSYDEAWELFEEQGMAYLVSQLDCLESEEE